DNKSLDADAHRKYIYGGHVIAYMKALIEDEPSITFPNTPGLGLNQTIKKSFTRRKQRLIERLNALNPAAGANDDDSDEDDE
nr:hypothetical protein [Tanacetum cinerariifolium]